MNLELLHNLLVLINSCSLRFYFSLYGEISPAFLEMFETSRTMLVPHYSFKPPNVAADSYCRHHHCRFIKQLKYYNKFRNSCEVSMYDQRSYGNDIISDTLGHFAAHRMMKFENPVLKIHVQTISPCSKKLNSWFCSFPERIWKLTHVKDYNTLSVPILLVNNEMFLAASIITIDYFGFIVNQVSSISISIGEFSTIEEVYKYARYISDHERKAYHKTGKSAEHCQLGTIGVKDAYINRIHSMLRINNITIKMADQRSSDSIRNRTEDELTLSFDIRFSGYKFFAFLDKKFLQTRHRSYADIPLLSLAYPLKSEVWTAFVACFVSMLSFIYAVHRRFVPLLLMAPIIEQDVADPRLTGMHKIVCLWTLSMFLVRQGYLSEVYSQLTAKSEPVLPGGVIDYTQTYKFPVYSIDHFAPRLENYIFHGGRSEKVFKIILYRNVGQPDILDEEKVSPGHLQNALRQQLIWTGCKYYWGKQYNKCNIGMDTTHFLVPVKFPITFDRSGGGLQLMLLIQQANKAVYGNEEPLEFLNTLTFWTVTKNWDAPSIKKLLGKLEQVGLLRKVFNEENYMFTRKTLEEFNNISPEGNLKVMEHKLNPSMLQSLRALDRLKTKRIILADQETGELRKVQNSDVVAVWQLIFAGYMFAACMTLIEMLYMLVITI